MKAVAAYVCRLQMLQFLVLKINIQCQPRCTLRTFNPSHAIDLFAPTFLNEFKGTINLKPNLPDSIWNLNPII